MRLKLVISLIIGNLLFLADCDIVSASEENPVPNKTQMIAAPWLSVNSDEGYVVGFTAGLTNQNDMTSYLTGSQSTEGYTSLGFRGENNLKDSRLVYETHLTRVLRKAYPDTPNFPEYSEKAVVNRFQLDISVLEKPIFEIGIPGILEMGPDLMLDFSKGERPVDRDGKSMVISDFPRFEFGSIFHLGLRVRYRTTNFTQRPVNGTIIDYAIRAGRADGVNLKKPVLDMTTEVKFTFARLLPVDSRVYCRVLCKYQEKTPPPNRYWLGGERTLRGQPDQREYGRRVLLGRLGLYKNIMRKWSLPTNVLNRIWDIFPNWKLDVESIIFYDVGVVGDPDFGWKPIRHGYGSGFRIVLPPEIVLSLDFAITPGGDVRFYFGAGESL